jgi:hypothetical protein
MAMIAINTNSSMSVKPRHGEDLRRLECEMAICMALCFFGLCERLSAMAHLL